MHSPLRSGIVWLALTALLYPLAARGDDTPGKPINDALASLWKDNRLTPSGVCSDHEFLRRVSLDLIGRSATLAELSAFEEDPIAERRARLVERLLKSEEHPRYRALLTADLLLP